MRFREIEATLPWGLHDAYLESLEIDWLSRRAVLGLRLMMSERQDMDQRARVIVEGLVYCSIEPPEIDASRGYEPTPEGGLQIDSGAGPIGDGHPAVPEGCFVQYFFVQDWNRLIHLCATEARLEWVEPVPVRSRSDTRAFFPGDEVDLSDG